MMKIAVVIMALGLSVVGCKKNAEVPDGSATQGIFSAADNLIPSVKPQGAAVLRQFLTKFKSSFSHMAQETLPSGAHAAARREVTTAAYLARIKEVGGIPRFQGKKILEDSVSGRAGSCAGASCAKAMGIVPGEEEQFFDEALKKVEANKELAQPKHLSIREVFIASLRKSKFDTPKEKMPIAEALALIAKETPRAWPQTAFRPHPILSTGEFAAKLSKEEHAALTDFTKYGFNLIREAEAYTPSELLAHGWKQKDIDKFTQNAHLIDSAVEKLPQVSGAIYRGIREVPAATVANLTYAFKNKIPIGLGPENKAALASASWDPRAALMFVKWQWNPARDKRYGILFAISGGHSGVSIENIALKPGQREVLLPSQAYFEIDGISPVLGEERMLIVGLKEIR